MRFNSSQRGVLVLAGGLAALLLWAFAANRDESPACPNFENRGEYPVSRQRFKAGLESAQSDAIGRLQAHRNAAGKAETPVYPLDATPREVLSSVDTVDVAHLDSWLAWARSRLNDQQTLQLISAIGLRITTDVGLSPKRQTAALASVYKALCSPNDGRSRMVVARDCAAVVSRSHDVMESVDLMKSMGFDPADILPTLLSTGSRRHPEQTARYVADHPEVLDAIPAHKVRMLQEIASGYARVSGAAAVHWAESLATDDLSAAALRVTLTEWLEQDSLAASEHVSTMQGDPRLGRTAVETVVTWLSRHGTPAEREQWQRQLDSLIERN
jgi:hypothetical protein